MINKISLLSILLFFLVGNTVFAHSNLDISPINNKVVQIGTVEPASASSLIKLASTQTSTDHLANTPNEETNMAAIPAIKAAEIEPSYKDYIVPGIVSLVLLIGFGCYWLIFRKKVR